MVEKLPFPYGENINYPRISVQFLEASTRARHRPGPRKYGVNTGRFIRLLSVNIGQLRARTRDRQRIYKRRKAHIRAIHARKHVGLC